MLYIHIDITENRPKWHPHLGNMQESAILFCNFVISEYLNKVIGVVGAL